MFKLNLDWRSARPALLLTFLVAGLLVGVRFAGWLQPLELAHYDGMVRALPDRGEDKRLLLVGITEADLQRYGFPIPDGVLAQALAKIEAARPQAIGFDLYKDLQPDRPSAGYQALMQALGQSDHLFGITKLGDSRTSAISAPPVLPPERIAFNDLLVDPGGVIRRNLLVLFPPEANEPLLSLSLHLALKYLESAKITVEPLPDGSYQLGKALLKPLTPQDGSYVNVEVGGLQLLAQYRSARASIEQVSLSELLADKIPPAKMRGRIVLLGSTAPSLQDFRYTPYSQGQLDSQTMAGVVIHAQMTSQILDAALGEQPLMWYWPEGVEVLWIAFWAGLGAVLGTRVQTPLELTGWTMGAVGVLTGIGYGLFYFQGWIPVIPPALALTVTGSLVITYSKQQAQQQQKMVMTLLGQSASPEIAEALWQGRDRLIQAGKLPGRKLVATLLFTDLQNFSTISEKMAPEDLLEWLNDYLEEVAQTVQAHQGIINKFTGDGIMAVFGVPVPRATPAEIASDAQHAVACGLALGERLAKMNQVWSSKGLPQVQMRVGIFTGPVVAGSLGGKSRLEYGVIGDTVNIASRLESYDKTRQGGLCRVLIGKDTLEHLGGHFEVEDWGPLLLKGKQQVVQVYQVLKELPQEKRA